jgi:hypothetical protein
LNTLHTLRGFLCLTLYPTAVRLSLSFPTYATGFNVASIQVAFQLGAPMRTTLLTCLLLGSISSALGDEPSRRQIQQWEQTLARRQARQRVRQNAIRARLATPEFALAWFGLLGAAMQAEQNAALLADAIAQAQARLAILRQGYAYGYEYYPADECGVSYYWVYYPRRQCRLREKRREEEIARERNEMQRIQDMLRSLHNLRREIERAFRAGSPDRASARPLAGQGTTAHAGRQPQDAPPSFRPDPLATLRARIEQINQFAQRVAALNQQAFAHPLVQAQITIRQTMFQQAATMRAAAAAQAAAAYHAAAGGHQGAHIGGHFGGGGMHQGGHITGHSAGGHR